MCATIDCTKTGKNIKNLCLEKGFIVNDLVYFLGVTPISVYNWFSGKKIPSIDHMVEIADLLGVAIDDLVIKKSF